MDTSLLTPMIMNAYPKRPDTQHRPTSKRAMDLAQQYKTKPDNYLSSTRKSSQSVIRKNVKNKGMEQVVYGYKFMNGHGTQVSYYKKSSHMDVTNSREISTSNGNIKHVINRSEPRVLNEMS